MPPSKGRIVLVTLSADCAAAIGGNAHEGDTAPAIVTEVFTTYDPPCVNVRILGDGPGAPLWSTSLTQGNEPGQWNWPPRVTETPSGSAG